jgi:hypothetical protein
VPRLNADQVEHAGRYRGWRGKELQRRDNQHAFTQLFAHGHELGACAVGLLRGTGLDRGALVGGNLARDGDRRRRFAIEQGREVPGTKAER